MSVGFAEAVKLLLTDKGIRLDVSACPACRRLS